MRSRLRWTRRGSGAGAALRCRRLRGAIASCGAFTVRILRCAHQPVPMHGRAGWHHAVLL